MNSKKYHTNIEKTGDNWTAQVVRQVSKLKTHVSKQQDGFTDEAKAQTWADKALSEFVNTQQQANNRQGMQRKESEEIKRQRSERRAEKTEAAKVAKEEAPEDED